QVFDTYLSKLTFHGDIDLLISTDGKILISGKLFFAADLVSVSAKLYADLSNITSGKAVVLFLSDVPDQIRLLSMDGKLELGFKDLSGQDVNPTVVMSAPTGPTDTTGRLSFPNDGETIDA